MPAMTKRVNVQARVAIRNTTPPIYGYHENIVMTTSDILKCLCKRAIVDEILPDGSLLRLNMKNYYLDNGAGLTAENPIRITIPKMPKPVVEEEKVPEAPVVEETKEEAPVEEPKVEDATEDQVVDSPVTGPESETTVEEETVEETKEEEPVTEEALCEQFSVVGEDNGESEKSVTVSASSVDEVSISAPKKSSKKKK